MREWGEGFPSLPPKKRPKFVLRIPETLARPRRAGARWCAWEDLGEGLDEPDPPFPPAREEEKALPQPPPAWARAPGSCSLRLAKTAARGL